jgi:hypothetical protein
MPTIKHTPKASKPSTKTSNTTAAKARAKVRKPAVAERAEVTTPVAVPSITQAATPPPAAPAATPAPAAPAPASPPAATSNAASAGSSGAADTSVAAPPQVTIPGVPANFVPANPADLRGFHALASEVAAVPDALAELQGFSNYGAVFGITAPDVGQLTQRLSVAYDWTMLLSQTTAWYKYAKSQQGLAWKDALLLLDALKAPFSLASTANPALLSQYPAIARLLGAQAVVAKRAAASRAKTKKAAATSAAEAEATAEATPTPAAAAAPAAGQASGAAAAPVAAARVVTVTG